MKKGIKIATVIVGAVVVTALGIDAADTLNGSRGTLLSQVIQSEGGCPKGMSAVTNLESVSCVDQYEASTGETCPVDNPTNLLDSVQNIEHASCFPESEEDRLPWRYVTREQALQACARVGKRLPSSEEWYQLSLGMSAVDTACNVSSGQLDSTGVSEACVSPHGAFDMVGNVWEWVRDDVVDGVHENHALPETGYVAQVDERGMATVSTSTEQVLFGKDYFWAKQEGSYGIIRGGFYGSDTDGGIYSVHADTLPTTAGTAIGFRCVK